MLGLALEGGGARGAYHIGAMQACMEEGLSFGAIAGTSIGAINGAMFAQGDYAVARELWLEITSADLFSEEESHFLAMISRGKLSLEGLSYFREKVREALRGGPASTPAASAPSLKNMSTSTNCSKARSILAWLLFPSPISRAVSELFKGQMEPDRVRDYILASA